MPLNVIRSFTNKLRVVVEAANGLIAVRAKQPSYFSGAVAMVHGKPFNGTSGYVPLWLPTNSANIILRSKHGVVTFFSETVFSQSIRKTGGRNAFLAAIGFAVSVYHLLGAGFARCLQAICSLGSVLIELRNRFFCAAFTAHLRDAIANRPSVLGMVRIIWHRLTLNPATFWSSFRRDGGDLAATTVAKMLFAHGERYNTEKV